MFGTMTKPFHAGKAASNGVLAAMLAASGFEARTDVLEAEQGFFSTQCDHEPADIADYTFGDHVRNNLFKYHAACYLTHSTMEALKILTAENELHPSAVRKVSIHVPETHLGVCNIEEPETGLQTKFSLRHCAAFILNRQDTAAISTFSDQNASAQELVALRQKVEVFGDLEPGTHSVVRVETMNGDVFSKTYDVGIPAKDLAKQEADLIDKFASLTGDRVAVYARKFANQVLSVQQSNSIHSFIGELPRARFGQS